MENLPEGANRLYLESSPYLQQHAYNPVDWFPWGEEALKRAEQENKMLLISIGYAACHWCHVMEHESFEDEEVANLMNDHFICVKVDREERPDIDDVYMTACQLSSGGNCGWPLNSFALPDGRPVWAGTYFPKENWMNILKQMHEMYQKDLARLQRAAESITEGISNFGAIEPVEAPGTFRFQEQVQITEAFLRNIDFSEGGPRRAPKFPMPNNYEYLLKWYAYSGDVRALKAVTLTLDKMSAGGIYDHLGGGFARYSVDSFWKVPHFEKMLYDNGQLLGLYADAYRLTRKENWLEVVRKTYRYLVREHLDSSGGLYSSYDADSEGEEGTYYIWSAKEMKQLLGQDYEIAADYYQVTEDGNWEGKNILHLAPSLDEVLSKHNLSAEDFKMKIKAINTILFKAREKREKPGLDDKILSSWNGLALEGLCKAYLATSDREILDTALKVASFLTETMMVEGGKLCRNYKDGKRSINGFLDDYANVISGLIELYQVTFEPKWLDKAYLLQQYVDRHFFNERDQMYAYTSDEDPPLVASTKNYSDNVIPAANSVTARNLFALGTYYASPEFLERAQQMISNIQPLLQRSSQPDFYSNWLQLYLYQVNAPYEVAILGPDACEIRMKMAQHYLPNIYFLGGQEEHLPLLEHKLVEGENMIYVCKNKVCKLPVKSVEKALIQVQE